MSISAQYRKLIWAGLLALAVILVFFLVSRRGGLLVSRLADPPSLLREIKRLNELVTVKYTIQKVVGLTEQKIPLGSESILLIVQARVLGGVDLREMSDRDFEPLNKRKIMIRLPEPRILHIVFDEKETKVWDRTKTWWTPWVPYSLDLEQRARVMALDSVRKSAIEMGILKDAERNAETSVREFLRAVGVESVFDTPPAGAS
ncbi:MAG: DUF4230 domain-containing protein [Acidobacteriota bacterium]|nr:DUF4230 domain-containing protein [Acidobacteriota bacterium]